MNIEIIAEHIADYKAKAYRAREWKIERVKALTEELDSITAEQYVDVEERAVVENEIERVRENYKERRDELLTQASTIRKLAKDLGVDMDVLEALVVDKYVIKKNEKPEVIVIGARYI